MINILNAIASIFSSVSLPFPMRRFSFFMKFMLHYCLCASNILVSSQIDVTHISNILKQFESRNEKKEKVKIL